MRCLQQSLATRGSLENKAKAVLQQQKSLVVNYFLIQKPLKKPKDLWEPIYALNQFRNRSVQK